MPWDPWKLRAGAPALVSESQRVWTLHLHPLDTQPFVTASAGVKCSWVCPHSGLGQLCVQRPGQSRT